MSSASGPQMARTDIIAVIPVLNEAGAIEGCLESLLEDDAFAQSLPVYVVDGGSTDGTQEILDRLAARFSNLRLLGNPERIQAAAVNRAVAASGLTRGYMIRCDGHALYPKGFLRAVTETLDARPEAASVVSVLDAEGGSGFQEAAAFIVDTPFGSGGSAHRAGRRSGWVDHGHHAGFRLDWFTRLGGYDTGFTHNEDAEFDHRLRQAGGRIWLDAGLRIDYQVRKRLSGVWRQYRNYGRGRARNWQKHRAPLRLRQIVPALHTALLGASLLAAPVMPGALGYPGLYLAFLAGIAVWGAVRLGSRAGLWAGPVLAAIHLGWGSGFLQQVAARPTPSPSQGIA